MKGGGNGMKRSVWLWLGMAGMTLVFAARCAQEGPGGTPGTAGTTGAAGTSTPGTAGVTGMSGNTGAAGTSTPGTAGVTGSSGDTGTAGTNPAGTAGTTGSSGNTGSSGTTGNAGTTGSAGTIGTAGTTGVAGTTGNAGRGGTTGNAGRGGTTGASGTTGTGGRGGAAGSGAGGAPDNNLVGGLDGYYWEVTPSGSNSVPGTNYPFNAPNTSACNMMGAWSGQGYTKTYTPLTAGGVAGQKYTINIGVRGVVGTRCYTGGAPAVTTMGSATGQNNTWYAGGTQYNDSIWNTMEIRVSPKVAGQANQGNSGYDVYFLNSFQNMGDWCQKEATYETKFNASFPVTGGGTVTFVVHDSNCRTLQNCGSVEGQASCNSSAARMIDMSGLVPAPMNFNQPRTGSLSGMTYYLQWVWIDVTSVTSP